MDDGTRARDRCVYDAESLALTPTADGHVRNFERARVANTEIYELKIHTRVDQVKMLWGG